ncbi:MAG: hypothetical protein ACI8XO_003885 [Verrucomicrobiales bacterium]|jgi:hypothetical protein
MMALKKIADRDELWAVAPWHAATLKIAYGKATENRTARRSTAKTFFRAPPKTSCGLELDKIPAVFVAKAPTITR